VVINSVAQYFPDAAYLVDVLRRALSLVADGGRIFLGDLRSRAHLEAFHTLVELHHAAPEARATELSSRVGKRVAQEAELVLDEAFFHALAREQPRIHKVQVELKRGSALNELTAFRYDVVLHVGTPPRVPTAAPVLHDVRSLDAVRAALTDEPPMVALRGVRNARLTPIAAVTTRLAAADDARADALLASLSEPAADALDPEALYTVDPRYSVSLRFSPDDPARFDAVLRHVDKGRFAASPLPAPAHTDLPDAYANRPASGQRGDALLGELRAHLRSTLPEYMVPATFVVLSAFPITPNGKIDRKALPAPERGARRAAASYSAPEAGIEQTIAGIWQEMLNLERVGRNDNIFELGANSLLTVQANSRLSAALGRKVSLVSMFRFPTVQSLAAHLGDDGKAAVEAEKRGKERDDRKKDAAERRRQARAERGI
jgi:Phosphopantetheine attachment site/AMP-binding enzyme C-terminal domain